MVQKQKRGHAKRTSSVVLLLKAIFLTASLQYCISSVLHLSSIASLQYCHRLLFASINYESSEGTEQNHHDGMNLEEACAYKGEEEGGDADHEEEG